MQYWEGNALRQRLRCVLCRLDADTDTQTPSARWPMPPCDVKREIGNRWNAEAEELEVQMQQQLFIYERGHMLCSRLRRIARGAVGMDDYRPLGRLVVWNREYLVFDNTQLGIMDHLLEGMMEQ
jgi:hypothetical protein